MPANRPFGVSFGSSLGSSAVELRTYHARTYRARTFLASKGLMYQSKPLGVTLLLWLVLIPSAWGAARVAAALRWWDALVEFDSRLSPGYLTLTGVIWAVAGIALCWSIIRHSESARLRVASAAGVWQLQLWVERVFFQSARANLPFALIATAVILLIVIVIVLHKSTIQYFSTSEEHEQADQSSKTA